MIEASGTQETILLTLGYAIVLGGVMVLTQVLGRATEWVRTIQGELVREHVTALVHRQSVALDMVFYDSPEYYDHLYRARAQASFRPVSLLENIGGLLQNGITIVVLTAVLFQYGFWVPFALFIGALPIFYVMLQHNRYQHDWYVRTTGDQRRAWYYDWLLTARAAAAEIRLFHLGDRYQAEHQMLRKRLRDERLSLAKRQGFSELGTGLFALLFTAAVMIWMVRQVLRGFATLGDLTLFYQAFNQGQNAFRSLLHNAGQLYVDSLFIQHFFEFLELEPLIKDPPQPLPPPSTISEGITFSNVAFFYPGSERAALQNFDLFVPAGKVSAIVGPNGAGKSTAIMILSRLYDPSSGSIKIDGTDIRAFSVSELQKQITILLQEPVHFQETVINSIALNNLNGNIDRLAVQSASRDAGADDLVAKLPNGYDNQLGTWFEGGTELSVGEWQRIALARAFLRKAPIIILDEPTSDMDPWAEIEWLKRFRKLAQGRTAIIITHRFTTASCADIIHVMDGGRIVESGTHTELLTQNGRYAASWHEQMDRQPSFSPLPYT